MESNGLIEYKDNLITKIRKFFIRIFKKNNTIDKELNENNEEFKKNENQEKFIEALKIDSNEIDKLIEKNSFLREIDGNEEMLNMLSIDRLKKLEEYYDDIIAKNNVEIKRLNETA